MARKEVPVRVAVACQGGGAHTAFTAGVLDAILDNQDRRFRVVALSGTSGGAVCALFAWCGLAWGDPQRGRELLREFWKDNAASSTAERLWNLGTLWAARSPVEGRLSPYDPALSWLRSQASLQGELWRDALQFSPAGGQDPGPGLTWAEAARAEFAHLPMREEFLDLETLLRKHLDFDALPKGLREPRLLVGAVEVLTGRFTAFDSSKAAVLPEWLLASSALPTLFRAVPVGEGLYWDGLFSQNPPVREFVRGVEVAEKPDQIWVVQINPRRRTSEPRSVEEILDRRNELSGNVSLQQELEFIKTLNGILRTVGQTSSQTAGSLDHYKIVPICRIQVDEGRLRREEGLDLDYASKLDRSPAFLGALTEHGRRQADAFLKGWPDRATYETYPGDES